MDGRIAETLAGHSVTVLDAGTDPRVQYRPQAVQEGSPRSSRCPFDCATR